MMRLTLALSVLTTLITFARAGFHLPVGSPMGLYMHSVSETGNVTLQYFGVDGNATKMDVAYTPLVPSLGDDTDGDSVSAQQSQATFCNNENNRYGEYSFIMGYLEISCQGGRDWNARTIAWAGSNVVAFACNYGKSQTCWPNHVGDASASITNQCGSEAGGWRTIYSWSLSYGRTRVGASFC
jgi:hypothetical protein